MRGVRDALEADQAPRTLAESMIRGDQPQSRRNVNTLADTLNVPGWWFELGAEEFVERLSAQPATTSGEEVAQVLLAEIQAAEARVLAAIARHQESLQDELRRQMHPEQTRKSQGS